MSQQAGQHETRNAVIEDFAKVDPLQGAVRAGLTSLRGDYQRAETELTAQRYAAEEALAARRDSFKTLFEETKTLDVQVRTSLRQRRVFETALRDSSDPVVEPADLQSAGKKKTTTVSAFATALLHS